MGRSGRTSRCGCARSTCLVPEPEVRGPLVVEEVHEDRGALGGGVGGVFPAARLAEADQRAVERADAKAAAIGAEDGNARVHRVEVAVGAGDDVPCGINDRTEPADAELRRLDVERQANPRRFGPRVGGLAVNSYFEIEVRPCCAEVVVYDARRDNRMEPLRSARRPLSPQRRSRNSCSAP